jgi:23S rRNA pseudoU1915 N3-methylase RlmH
LRCMGSIRLLQLSGLIMPHWLAYLVLIEQIYRSLEIIKWSGYHHN